MSNIHELKEALKEIIENDPTLKKYLQRNGNRSFRRFWNLFRTDLMRKRPDEVADFLNQIDQTSRLADLPEGSQFGRLLAAKFFGDLPDHNVGGEQRLRQEALIVACLEMDAAMRLHTADNEVIVEQRKIRLKERLALWNIPQ